MDELSKILNDPDSMQKIISLAQSLAQPKSGDDGQNPSQTAQPTENTELSTPENSPALSLLQSLANSPAGQAFFKGEKQRIQLLKSLEPYLDPAKKEKLTRVVSAMESVAAIGSLSKIL